MSKAGLWPREKPRPTESNAEIRLYEAFASDLPSNWTVWHSLRIRTDEGMEGEGDFVIAIPDRGFLVLEVKGGYISVRDGRWFQNSKPLDHSPREQAHSFAKKLVSRLPSVNGMTVPYGILTIFPDTPSSDAPVQDNLRDMVLTEVDVRYLKDAITAKLAKDAKVWIFHDPAQAFWEERRLPVWVGDLSNYRLNKCYRCPEPIMEYSKALSQQPHDVGLVKDGFAREIIGTVECPSESSIPAKIENEIRKLLSRGFKAGDIAVLSLRGRSAESVAGQDKIGSFAVVRADSPDIDENIVADTFLRFKGLERPAIIVTDLRLVKDRFDVRMHIALSRALDVVRVVGMKELEPFRDLLCRSPQYAEVKAAMWSVLNGGQFVPRGI